MPTVTVGIPTYNRSPLLRRAIESVLAQTLADLEVIVFDNASTDDTADVVASFDDPRLTYHRNAENVGHRVNGTNALRSGTAPYVAVLFDDEFMMPRNLERKVAMMEADPRLAMVHSAFRQVDQDGRILDPFQNWCGLTDDAVESGEEFITRSFERPCRVHVASALFRRDVAAREAFRVEDAPADDHALWLRVATYGDVGYLHDPLVSFTVTAGWSSQNGFMEIIDGSYRWTFQRVEGFRSVLERFLETQSYAPDRERQLRELMARAHRRLLVAAVRDHGVADARPLRSSAATLREAVRLDPRVVLDLRLGRALAGRARELAQRRAGVGS